MKRPFFIDTDTASDDAVALMIAFADENALLTGISIVGGNVPLPFGVQNALYIRELCGANTPIYAGASQPMSRPLETAQFVHGDDGMGDIGLPLTGRTADGTDGVRQLIESARRHAGELELVTLGPLTNIAMALLEAPDIASKIKRCVIMGGASDVYGNITPVSEFNLWVDPEAAKIVFESDLPKVMAGWDVSRKYAVITDEDADEIRRIGTEKARVAIESQVVVRRFCEDVSGFAGFDFPDPIAMAIALDPSIITSSHSAAVSISTAEGHTRGMAIIDDRSLTTQARTTEVVTEADRERFLSRLKAALR